MTSRSGRYGRVDIAARFAAQLPPVRVQVEVATARIPEPVRFVDWVESISEDRRDTRTGELVQGLRIDGKPFDLRSRPAMRWIYEQLPSTRNEAARKKIVLMKCAQVGFTVMEILWVVFFALKYDPVSIGMFLPDAGLARAKSSERFMPIARSVPAAVSALRAAAIAAGRPPGSEGNVTTRQLGGSKARFLHTTGRASTESNPMDVVSFDEVQEMLIADMEKVLERLSGSDLKFVLMGSTANWPDADIHYWYQRGTRHRFHTRCPACGREEPLDDYFPDCIGYDEGHPDRVTGLPGDFRYRCREGHWIDDSQAGEWKADDPDQAARGNVSIHFHQMLSPTISPREMMEGYRSADDMKNFWNRKLGKPYQDPSQIPVTLEHLNKCAAEGMALGLEWKTRAQGTFMGIDQMGRYNVVVIKERLPDGRQAVIHVEEIFSPDPFERCDELMEAYGVQVCLVESLPNFNDAHRFATRHPAKVFLAAYSDLKDDAIRWGDAPRLDTSDRRTAEGERTRYTVTLDQYKCMSLSLARLVHTKCLFPDPQMLTQEVIDKGVLRRVATLKDRAFLHFQRTALVTERVRADERQCRRKVKEVGLDPHFSFANLLCDVAWSRAHGTATFILPNISDPNRARRELAEQMALHGAPKEVIDLLEPRPVGDECGRCIECPMGKDGPPARFFCQARQFETGANDPGCPMFVGA